MRVATPPQIEPLFFRIPKHCEKVKKKHELILQSGLQNISRQIFPFEFTKCQRRKTSKSLGENQTNILMRSWNDSRNLISQKFYLKYKSWNSVDSEKVQRIK